MSALFAHRFGLAQLRDGQRIELGADADERTEIARRLGLLSLDRFAATATMAKGSDEIRARGRIAASVVQACVASGDPVTAEIDEPFDILFRAEPEVGPDSEIELSAEDCDVAFHDGREIDLGAALIDTLALALDPYPRSARAADALKEAGVLGEEEAGPFAALAALKGK